jgi:hypothetical protein
MQVRSREDPASPSPGPLRSIVRGDDLAAECRLEGLGILTIKKAVDDIGHAFAEEGVPAIAQPSTFAKGHVLVELHADAELLGQGHLVRPAAINLTRAELALRIS